MGLTELPPGELSRREPGSHDARVQPDHLGRQGGLNDDTGCGEHLRLR